MEMNSKFFDTDFVARLIDMLAKQLGSNSEIVLHDLRNGFEHSIVDIRNGHITGRAIGGPSSNLGLEVALGTSKDSDKYNYITKLPDGRFLRSSSLYIKDKEKNIVGCLCINTDITQSLQFENFLRDLNQCDFNTYEDEIYASNVTQLLDGILIKTQLEIGKEPEKMTREEKIEFVKGLNKRGAFLITKSGERVQEFLGISKYTLYKYLEIANSSENSNENGT